MKQDFEYQLSSVKKCQINEIAQLFNNFSVPYEIVKECEDDLIIFSIYYNNFDDCENSQILADRLEDLAIKYNL